MVIFACCLNSWLSTDIIFSCAEVTWLPWSWCNFWTAQSSAPANKIWHLLCTQSIQKHINSGTRQLWYRSILVHINLFYLTSRFTTWIYPIQVYVNVVLSIYIMSTRFIKYVSFHPYFQWYVSGQWFICIIDDIITTFIVGLILTCPSNAIFSWCHDKSYKYMNSSKDTWQMSNSPDDFTSFIL